MNTLTLFIFYCLLYSLTKYRETTNTNVHKLQFLFNSLEEGFIISRDVENIHAWT